MMNKRYLFRGKDVFSQEWKEGCYSAVIEPTDEQGVLLHYIVDMENNSHIIYPSTLGQCTGLKDKNGKLIFEGDVVKVNHEKFEDKEQFIPLKLIRYSRNYAVEFWQKTASWRVRNKKIHFGLTSNIIYNQSIEIIGTIHENPELLEKTNGE